MCCTAKAGIQPVRVLPANRALLLEAKEGFEDLVGNGHNNAACFRSPGQRWLFYGPGEYWPPLQVQVLNEVSAVVEIEELGLYIFRPIIPVLCVIAVLFVLALWLWLRATVSSPLSRVEL
jgi:hypothetical protein